MAYDDIRITQLPEIQNIEDNDSIIINDATNDLTYRVDWRDLKNSIGTISNGITFPLGERDYPSVAIGDATSGIYGSDYGTFVIVTHGRDRIRINQAGTTEIVNGNVVIGNFDKACYYTLTINNTTRFNCLVNMDGGLNLGGDLDVGGDISGGGDLIIDGDSTLGTDCDNKILIKGELVAECGFDLAGDAVIGGDILGDGDLTIKGDATIGSGCNNEIILNGNTTVKCDLTVDKELTVGGDVNFDVIGGTINIGNPDTQCRSNTNQINLNGNVYVLCDIKIANDLTVEGNLNVENDLTVLGDVLLGSNGCLEGSVTIDAPTTINCDLTVEGNLQVNGDGPHSIGPSDVDCDDDPPEILLNGSVEIQCDLEVGGDSHLKGDLQVDGGLTVGDKNEDCDESPIELNGNVEINCDLDVKGDTTLNNINVTGDGPHIIGPPGEDCDTAPDIDLNGNVTVSCDLDVEGDINLLGDINVGGGDINLGKDCLNDNINILGQLNTKCDAYFDGDVFIDHNLTIGENCFDHLQVNGTMNVVCDSTFDQNVSIENNLTVKNGDILIENGGFIGDGSQLVNLNIPGSLRFKGDWNAGDPPPNNPVVGDFYLNNSGDGSTPSVVSNPSWQFTENLANPPSLSGISIAPCDPAGGCPPGSQCVNGSCIRIEVLLNQHMIYTVDGVWMLGSTMDVDGYVSLATEQTITQTKRITHNTIEPGAPLDPADPDGLAGPDIIHPVENITLRHNYGIWSRAYAIDELRTLPIQTLKLRRNK